MDIFVRMRKSTAKISLSKMSLGPSLLPWTIIEVNEDTYTFEALFTTIQGGRFNAVTISEDLKSARLLRSLLGQCCRNRIMTSLEF